MSDNSNGSGLPPSPKEMARAFARRVEIEARRQRIDAMAQRIFGGFVESASAPDDYVKDAKQDGLPLIVAAARAAYDYAEALEAERTTRAREDDPSAP